MMDEENINDVTESGAEACSEEDIQLEKQHADSDCSVPEEDLRVFSVSFI